MRLPISGLSAHFRHDGFEKIGGAEEDRTPDLSVANAALSQLSYGPTVSTHGNESSGAERGG
jgi:hypothetical protein